MDQLLHAGQRQGQLAFKRPTDPQSNLPLPPTASLQSLLASAPNPLPHVHLSDYVGPPMSSRYFESFLDTHWPPSNSDMADKQLLDLANSLSDALHVVSFVSHQRLVSIGWSEVFFEFVMNSMQVSSSVETRHYRLGQFTDHLERNSRAEQNGWNP